jgi:hypothetical protein
MEGTGFASMFPHVKETNVKSTNEAGAQRLELACLLATLPRCALVAMGTYLTSGLLCSGLLCSFHLGPPLPESIGLFRTPQYAVS